MNYNVTRLLAEQLLPSLPESWGRLCQKAGDDWGWTAGVTQARGDILVGRATTRPSGANGLRRKSAQLQGDPETLLID